MGAAQTDQIPSISRRFPKMVWSSGRLTVVASVRASVVVDLFLAQLSFLVRAELTLLVVCKRPQFWISHSQVSS